MHSGLVYREKVISNRTTALFVMLTILFLFLFAWRLLAASMDWAAVLVLVLACLFLFYTINYRALDIQLNLVCLRLKFGIFSWRIPLINIAHFELDDEVPWLMRSGGAGIHFMFVHGRYRASFNFLEHPRVVISFKNKIGPILDISFSTSQPAQILTHLEEAIHSA